MEKKQYFLIKIFLIATLCTNAQQYFGGHPLGQHWQILNSPAIRIIHPKGMTPQAERIANIINYINQHNRRSVGNKKRRIDMVLQTQTTIPNGYVALAPFRSEFYATPPQSLSLGGSLSWLDLLSIHEYRHVLQNINGKNGIVKFFYYLGGEYYWAVLNNLVLPSWYYEGDAVITETALSKSGRGRIPYFTIQQRALINEKINYSYLKNRNGSYKSMVPNRYPLGYMMMTYLRNHYGNDVSATILNESTAFKGFIYPFSKAIKRHTGIKNTTKLYHMAWQEFKEKTKHQLKNTQLIATTPLLHKTPKTITTYSYPILLDNNTVIARKKSYTTTDILVKIKNGKETKITSIGLNNDDFLSYNHHLLTWTESTRNPRRGLQNYSDIITYDLRTNHKKRLTKSTRYFSPSISPDGTKIATIHISPLEKYNLCILNAKTGQIEKTFDNPKNNFLSRTTWAPDGKNIVSILKKNGQLCLVKINIKNGKITELTPWTAHTLKTPFANQNKVYFNASYSGIDNIYSTDLLGSKQIKKETSVIVGAFQPNVYKNKLMFTELNSKGFKISSQKLRKINSFISYKEPDKMEQFNTVANQTEGGNILTKIDSIQYKTQNYKGLFTGLKFQAWGVVPSTAISSINLGVVNMLNDVALNLSAGINYNEANASLYNASFVVSRFYPEITFTATKANRNTYFINRKNKFGVLRFKDNHFGINIGIPLTWYKGNYITSFKPSIGLNHVVLSNANTILTQNNINTYSTGINFSTYKRTATQNLGPRLGLVINASKITSIGNTNNANKINISSSVYLPGLFKNDYIKISGAYQKEALTNTYQTIDSFLYPRGYNAPINDEFTSIKTNYSFPSLYPDMGFGGIIYFKRIKTNLFYDYGVGKINKDQLKTTYNSIGTEILFDNVYFNAFPISAGIRYYHLLNNNSPFVNKNPDGFQFILTTKLGF